MIESGNTVSIRCFNYNYIVKIDRICQKGIYAIHFLCPDSKNPNTKYTGGFFPFEKTEKISRLPKRTKKLQPI